MSVEKQETALSQEELINDTFAILQRLIEEERIFLLKLIGGRGTEAITSRPPDLSLERRKAEIRQCLQQTTAAAQEHGIPPLTPSKQTVDIMADIGRAMGLLRPHSNYPGPRYRRELAVLSILAGGAESSTRYSLKTIAELTGYAAATITSTMKRLQRLLEHTPWIILGDRQTGWTLTQLMRQPAPQGP